MYLIAIVIALSPIILKCTGTDLRNRKAINRNAFPVISDFGRAESSESEKNYRNLHLTCRNYRGFYHPDPHFQLYEQFRLQFLKHVGLGPAEDYHLQDNFQNWKDSSVIPLDLIRKFNNFSEINDVLINLVEGHTQDEAPALENRFDVGERSAAIIPKSAACMPELQTVKIASNDDPSILYVPSCTRLERCGGCCTHSLLSCQPTDVETVSFQVVKTQFVGGSKLKFMGKEVVLVDKHTKCKCDCKVQEKDCNRFQEYRKSECRCACTNIDEEKKCYKENITKLWNPDICACECRSILQCSTGYTFDAFRCRCVPVYIRRRYAEMNEHDQEKTHYKTEDLPVVPLVEAENTKHNL